MRLSVTLNVLVLVGCTSPNGRADTVPYGTLLALPTHTEAQLEAAEEILGMDLVPYERGQGAVTIIRHPTVIEEDGGIIGGASLWIDKCSPIIWADDRRIALAHELGHALGLEHVDDKSNLMHWQLRGDQLTEAQVDRMRELAWIYLHEC